MKPWSECGGEVGVEEEDCQSCATNLAALSSPRSPTSVAIRSVPAPATPRKTSSLTRMIPMSPAKAAMVDTDIDEDMIFNDAAHISRTDSIDPIRLWQLYGPEPGTPSEEYRTPPRLHFVKSNFAGDTAWNSTTASSAPASPAPASSLLSPGECYNDSSTSNMDPIIADTVLGRLHLTTQNVLSSGGSDICDGFHSCSSSGSGSSISSGNSSAIVHEIWITTSIEGDEMIEVLPSHPRELTEGDCSYTAPSHPNLWDTALDVPLSGGANGNVTARVSAGCNVTRRKFVDDSSIEQGIEKGNLGHQRQRMLLGDVEGVWAKDRNDFEQTETENHSAGKDNPVDPAPPSAVHSSTSLSSKYPASLQPSSPKHVPLVQSGSATPSPVAAGAAQVALGGVSTTRTPQVSLPNSPTEPFACLLTQTFTKSPIHHGREDSSELDSNDNKHLKTLKDLIEEANEVDWRERAGRQLHAKKEAMEQKTRRYKEERDMERWRRWLSLPSGSVSCDQGEGSMTQSEKGCSQGASGAGGGSASSTIASMVSSLKEMIFRAHQGRMEQKDLWSVLFEARKLGRSPPPPRRESSSLSSSTSWPSRCVSSCRHGLRKAPRAGCIAIPTISNRTATGNLYPGNHTSDNVACSAPARYGCLSSPKMKSNLKSMTGWGACQSYPIDAAGDRRGKVEEGGGSEGNTDGNGKEGEKSRNLRSWTSFQRMQSPRKLGLCCSKSSVAIAADFDKENYGRIEERTHFSALEGCAVTAVPSVVSTNVSHCERSLFDDALLSAEDSDYGEAEVESKSELLRQEQQEYQQCRAKKLSALMRSRCNSKDEIVNVFLRPEDPAYLTEFPRILCHTEMSHLAALALPASLTFHCWTRLYSLARDGDSFGVFLSLAGPASRSLLVVQTTRGNVFGAYVNSPWSMERDHLYAGNKRVHGWGATFYGSEQACLWRLDRNPSGRGDGVVSAYKWTGANRYIQLVDVQRRTVAFGGGGDRGDFGLVLEDDFRRGSTAPCATFDNEPLCDSEHFNIVDVEVWGFDSFT